jgi:hypothetical protein
MILYYNFQNTGSYPGTGYTANNLITGSIFSGRTLSLLYTTVPPVYSTVNYGEITYNGNGARGTANMIGADFDFSSLSLGGWYKCSNDNYGTLFSRGGGFAEAPGYSMNIAKNISGQIEFELITSRDRNNNIKTSYYTITSYQNLVVGQWYYVMAVWDRTNNLRLYINGVLQSMLKIADLALFGGPNYNQAALVQSSGVGSYMSGSFGDLELYGVPLSTTRVIQNFNAKTGSYGTTYVTSSQIPINYQLSVDNYNTGSMKIYVDRGSGFNLEIDQTVYGGGSTENMINSRILINPNNVFYAVVNDKVVTIGDNSYLNVFNDTTNVQSITGSASIPTNSVTMTQITGSLGSAYLLQGKAGTSMNP